MDRELKAVPTRALDLRGICGAFADSSPLPTAAVDGSGHVVRYVNRAFCRLLAKSREELIGRDFCDVAPAGPDCLALLDRVYRTGKPETHTGEEVSAGHFYWSYVMWPVAPAQAATADKGASGIVIQVTESGPFHDDAVAMNQALMLGSIHQHELTETAERLNWQLQAEMDERGQAEMKLRESEELFRTLFNSAPIAVFVCDINAVIQNYNQRAMDLWGRKPVCGAEKHCGSVRLWLPNGELLPHNQSPVIEVLRTGVPAFNVEVYIERPDGSRLPVLVNFAALKDAKGEISGAVTSFVDISERKQAEEALRKSEKLAAAGRMAATIAHEINNPLEAVTNLCYLLRGEALNQHAAELVHTLEAELGRVAHITKQTLAFYREGKRPAEVDLSKCIDAVVELFAPMAAARGAKIKVDSKASPHVYALDGEMRQVFSNLITNALDAGATILRIRVSPSQDSNTHSNGRCRDGVRIVFADNGAGIPAGMAAKLFEPFFTTKEKKGTGLGLWVSKGIIKKHEGWIRMRTSTAPGRSGTTVRVFLPAISSRSLPEAVSGTAA